MKEKKANDDKADEDLSILEILAEKQRGDGKAAKPDKQPATSSATATQEEKVKKPAIAAPPIVNEADPGATDCVLAPAKVKKEDAPPTTTSTTTASSAPPAATNDTSNLPGAYALAPTAAETTNTGSLAPAITTSLSVGIPTTNNENAGLAVASAVPEEDPNLIQEAAEMQPSQNRDHAKEVKRNTLVAVIAIVVVALIVVAVVAPGKNNSDQADASVEATPIPSPAPTSLEQGVLDLLPEHTRLALGDPESVQSQAFDWLLDDIAQNPTYADPQILQRFALATLYYSTKGERWVSSEHWLNHSVNECDWFQIDDFAVRGYISQLSPGYLDDFFPSGEQPSPCSDEQGLMEHLWLDLNNLEGPLPPEVYLLTSLETFSLSLNVLSGTISSLIGSLTALEAFIVGYNPFTPGVLPSQLGLLSDSMRALGLYSGNYIGQVPTELWDLTHLSLLILAENPQLKGSIPSVLGDFQDLTWLLLQGCDMTGIIPTELGHRTMMERLLFGRNNLSGSIPSELGLLSRLTQLNMDTARLTGNIPSELGLLTALTAIDMERNQLSGTLPTELGIGLSSLTVALHLHDNELLSGSIPTELGLLTSAYEISLQNNQFTGVIPSEIGHISALGLLNLANNSLSGTVPTSVASLANSLYSVRLEGNPMLSGTIPTDLCTINNTCLGGVSENPCEASNGLYFDCSGAMCGCDCPCN